VRFLTTTGSLFRHFCNFIYIRGVTVHIFIPNHHDTDVVDLCIQSDDEYSQSQAIHTPIQKGAHAVMQCCLLTATTEKSTEEQQTIYILRPKLYTLVHY